MYTFDSQNIHHTVWPAIIMKIKFDEIDSKLYFKM